ncbi:MAG: right-handed parallel beta-helix repeat-containing protein [Bacteroidales bacterium]
MKNIYKTNRVREMLKPLATLILFIALLFATLSSWAATKTSAGSGYWSNAATWSPSGVPAAGDDVVIQAGHIVSCDVDYPGTLDYPATLNSLTVNGTLNRLSSYLTTGSLSGASTGVITSDDGVLIVDGSANTTYAGKFSGPSYSGGQILQKDGSSTLTLTGISDYTYTDPYGRFIEILGGTLKMGVANALPSITQIYVHHGGTWDLNGFDQTIAYLADVGQNYIPAPIVTNSSATAATLTIVSGGMGYTGQYESTMNGNLSLVILYNYSIAGSGIAVNVSVTSGSELTLGYYFDLNPPDPPLSNTAALSGDLSVEAGGTVRVGNTASCNKLYLAGVQQVAGTYGSSTSTATYKNDNFFVGDYVLTVANGPSPVRVYSDNAETILLSSHATIQAGINAAAPGNYIRVDAGTYTEALLINKALTIRGPNAAVSPNGGSRVGEAIIDLTGGSVIKIATNNIILKGFKIVNLNQQGAIISGGSLSGTTAAANVTIEKNLFDNLKGNAIYTYGSISNWTVTDNKIQNVSSYTSGGTYGSAMGFWLVASNITITNNTISNCSWEGIQFVCYATSANTVLIQNNTLTNIAHSGMNIATNLNNVDILGNTITSANTSLTAIEGGIIIQGLGNVVDAVISGNTISGSYNGIYVQDNLTGKDLVVNNNNLSGNVNMAIKNDATGTLAATCNWYGTTVPATIAGMISGSVTYIPYNVSSSGPCNGGLGPITTIQAPIQISCGAYDVPVTVKNFTDIGAISLVLNSDASVLEYQGVTVNPIFNGSTTIQYTAPPGQFRIGYFGNTVSLADDDVLFTLHFNLLPTVAGTTNLSWNTLQGDCEFAGPNGDPVYTSTFNDLATYWTIPTRPVKNINTGIEYCTIQAAIDAAQTLNTHTITVAAGTYPENVIINKSLTLKGANADKPCPYGNRLAESIISGSSSAAITILADGVTIDGFEITNPSGNYAITATGRNNLLITNNNIHHIGTLPVLSGNTHAVAIVMSSTASIQNITISDNCISEVKGGENPALTGNAAKLNNGTASAVGVGWSNATNDIVNLLIEDNTISNITACTQPFANGGKGAYGVIVNVGAGSAYTGKAVSPVISCNSISVLSGCWAHGIGLEGETPGAIVFRNDIKNLTSTKSPSDAVCVMIEDNAGAGTVAINENSFTLMSYGIVNTMAALTVDGTKNWWGTTGPIPPLVGGNVTWKPFYTTGVNVSTHPPCFQSSGTPVDRIQVSLTETHVDVTCFGGNTGSIDLTVNGGIAPFTYAWTASNGGVIPAGQENNQDLTGLTAGTYNVTVTDGNLSVQTLDNIVLIVTDNEAPIVTTCPASYDIEGCSTAAITGLVYSENEVEVTAAQFNTAGGAATDNCSITYYSYKDVSNGTCPIVITRTWTLKDGMGNAKTCVQTITIHDNTAPSMTTCPPEKLLVGCTTAAITLVYSETEVVVTAAQFTAEGGLATDACGITYYSYIDSKTGSCPVIVTRLWKIKDACNNTTTCTQTIKINHTAAPVVPANGSSTVACVNDAVPPLNAQQPCNPAYGPTPWPDWDVMFKTYMNSNVDQQQTTFSNWYMNMNTGVGQSFIPQSTGQLTKIDVNVYTYVGSPSFNVQIYAGDGKTGTPIYSAGGYSISGTGWKSLTLASGPILNSGTQYTFWLTPYPYNSVQLSLAYPSLYANGQAWDECSSTLQSTVTDACGTTIPTPTPVITGTYNGCSGTKIYTYTYTDCAGLSSDWVYTYTISPPVVTMPNPGSSTVACASLAILPTPPVVSDNCGRTLSVSAGVPGNNPTCAGTKTWSFTYTDCAGVQYPWVYTYTIAPPVVTMPNAGSSIVACVAFATEPTPPEVKDNCNRALSVSSGVPSADPACAGTKTWTFTYTDCAGVQYTWVYTYTISAPVVTMPNAGSSTVACVAFATEPTPPEVKDNCNRILTVSAGVEGNDPTCAGTKTWTFTYTDCAGVQYTWVYTYTISAPVVTMPNAGSSTVACVALATEPTPPVVLDNCNRALSVSAGVPGNDPVCAGTKTWTFTYTDCEGVQYPWVYTYTISAPVVTMPNPGGSTVECASLAIEPTPPIIKDNCGRTLNVSAGETGNNPACIGSKTWTFTYTDCNNTSYSWVYTYTILHSTLPTEIGGPIASASNVECVSAAIPPTSLPVVKDVCNNTLTPGAPLKQLSFVNKFDAAVTLGATPANGVWYTDRYAPYGFTSPVSFDGGNRLMESINASDYQGAGSFYNTQGRAYDVGNSTNAMEIKLYVPSAWELTNKRLAGFWGVAVDASNAVSGYPIVEFTTDGNNPRFRVWESGGTGGWYDLGLPQGFVFNSWVTLKIRLLPTGEFLLSAGSLNYVTHTSVPDASVRLKSVILQGYNSATSYDIYWDNFVYNNTYSDICEGAITYTYDYADCAGLPYSWTYTYNIKHNTAPVVPANGSSTVACVSLAVPLTSQTVIDQQQLLVATDLSSPNWIDFTSIGQSFTCGITGKFTKLDLKVGSLVLAQNFTLKIFDGNGIGGTLLYSGSHTLSLTGWQSLNIAENDAPELIAGHQYTFWLSAFSYNQLGLLCMHPDVYSGGVSMDGCITGCNPPYGWQQWPAYDLVFKTYMTALPVVKDVCGTVISTPTPVVTDNITNCSGTRTYKYTYTDCANLSTDWTYTYNIIPPAVTFANVSAITVNCGAVTTSSLAYSNGLTDACAINGSVTSTLSAIPGACGGDVTETWTAIVCGNTITKSRIIHVNPAAVAAFDAIGDITVACGAATTHSLSYTNGKTGTCEISGSVTSTLSIQNPAGYCGGDVTETWTYTDNCNRTITQSRIIHVSPAAMPVFATVADITVPCGGATTSVLGYDNNLSSPCNISGSVTSTLSVQSPEGYCGGDITETWTVVVCGNTITKTRIIHVSPAAVAAFDAIGDITVDCGTATTHSLSYTNGKTGTCEISGSVTSTLSIQNPAGYCGGDVTETWTYTDNCNRTITQSRIIHVSPTAVAAFDAIGDITVDCGTATTHSLSYTNGKTGTCEISGSVTSTLSIQNPAGYCGGDVTETWTYTDNCNRTITQSRIIHVSPATTPAFPAVQDITVDCGGVTTSDLTYDNGLPGNCRLTGTVTSTLSTIPGACGGNVTETWTAIVCGNTITQSRIIHVSPATLPTMTAPVDITISCIDLLPTASSITYSNGLSGNCLISGTSNNSTFTTTVAGSCNGKVTETWTAVDACGRNLIPVSRIITINDNIAPVITCPQDITVNMNTGCTYVGSIGTATATDNCTPTLAIVISSDKPAVFPEGNTTVTWKAKDMCDNEISCTQIVTVIKNSLIGKLTYNNTNHTVLNNVTLTLNPGALTTVTDASGNYSFNDLCAGNYTIAITQNNKPAGGINSTDAAQVNAWGANPTPIELCKYFAGDVLHDVNMNGADAGRILQHFVTAGNPSFIGCWDYWKVGDVCNSNSHADCPNIPFTIVGGVNTVNLLGQSAGDFNSSFTPGSLKSTSDNLTLDYGQNMQINQGTIFELPVYAGMNMNVSAISMILNFPSNLLEIQGVYLTNDPNNPLQFSVSNNELRIGWNSLQAVNLLNGDRLLTLKLKLVGSCSSEGILLTLAGNPLNELADENYNVINNALLIVDKINASAVNITNPVQAEKLSLSNHPNPFKGTTTIDYTLPYEGKVIIEIFDILGQRVSIAVNEIETAGAHTLVLDAKTFAPGVYTCTLQLNNSGKVINRTIKMMSK